MRTLPKDWTQETRDVKTEVLSVYSDVKNGARYTTLLFILSETAKWTGSGRARLGSSHPPLARRLAIGPSKTGSSSQEASRLSPWGPRLALSSAPHTAIWQPQIHGICTHMREIASELCSGLCKWLLGSKPRLRTRTGSLRKRDIVAPGLREKSAGCCLLRQAGNN